MPIYEFYCEKCNMIFNFLSSRIDTTSKPDCPKCGRKNLSRQISKFATIKSGREGIEDEFSGIDESKMEKAFESLLSSAEGMNEDDPKQMASVMRKFTKETGLHLGDAMEEAISRMEAGEDPDTVEKEMGDMLEGDDISVESIRKRAGGVKARPVQDEKLYKL